MTVTAREAELIPVLSLLRRHPWTEKGCVDTIVEHPVFGYTSVCKVYPELMDAQQRADYEAWVDEAEGWAQAMVDAFGPDAAASPTLFFFTLDDAVAHSDLLDRIHCIDEDLRAFRAPSECRSTAYGNTRHQLEVIENRGHTVHVI